MSMTKYALLEKHVLEPKSLRAIGLTEYSWARLYCLQILLAPDLRSRYVCCMYIYGAGHCL